jgi:hypothetical protein
MFRTAENFSGNINDWDVTSVTDMNNMFNGSNWESFINLWELNSLIAGGGVDFFAASKVLPASNYDSLLIGWASNGSIATGVTFNFGSSKYSAGGATTARGILATTRGWTITDGGQV